MAPKKRPGHVVARCNGRRCRVTTRAGRTHVVTATFTVYDQDGSWSGHSPRAVDGTVQTPYPDDMIDLVGQTVTLAGDGFEDLRVLVTSVAGHIRAADEPGRARG